MRRHLPYQVSYMFPFALLALALCGENSLQNPLFPRSRGSGTGRRFLTAIQAKNNTNVSVWTKRSHTVPI